jgi:hypothetical protein
MFFDSLTIAALIISVSVALYAVLSNRRVRRKSEERLRRVAQQNAFMNENPLARQLCMAIRERYPEACPGLDFLLDKDGDDVKLAEWDMDKPKPDAQQLRRSARERTRAD